jgi:hypothetical protein
MNHGEVELQPLRGRQFFARMDSSSIGIICIRLPSFALLGHPITVAFRYLQALFPATSNATNSTPVLIFHDLVLDLDDSVVADCVGIFQSKIRKLLKELQK